MQIVADPTQNLVLNLLGVRLEERPKYFASLMAELLELRARTGRPHWIIIDEAHHVLPQDNDRSGLILPQELTNVVMVTVEPQMVLRNALERVDMIFGVGQEPQRTIRHFARGIGLEAPRQPKGNVPSGESLVWEKGKPASRQFEVALSSFEHRRHRRKYATGDVGPEESFYFRGPERRFELQARNLIEFLRIARGLDDETWLYHLRHKDYSAWFEGVIKDPELGKKAAMIERNRHLSADESLRRIEAEIGERYTLPSEHIDSTRSGTG
jgi:hypothetical protein